MTAWACTECAADPTTAPGRYCASLRCYCNHETCPAWQPRAESVASAVYLPAPKETT